MRSDEKMVPTLVQLKTVTNGMVRVVIPAWCESANIPVNVGRLPDDLLQDALQDTFLIAKVNIGASRAEDVVIGEIETNTYTLGRWDLIAYIQAQREWSKRTFGPGERTGGVTAHIAKELDEILAAPHDLSEWVDVIILALDGAWRAGWTPWDIARALAEKQRVNFLRRWPPPGPQDVPNEHVSDEEHTND